MFHITLLTKSLAIPYFKKNRGTNIVVHQLTPWLEIRNRYNSYCFSMYKGDSVGLLKHKGCLLININQISLFSSTNNCTIDIFTIINGKHNHHMHYLIIPCAWLCIILVPPRTPHTIVLTIASFSIGFINWKGSNECTHIKRNQRHQGQTLFQGLHLRCDIPCWFFFFIFTIFHTQFTIMC